MSFIEALVRLRICLFRCVFCRRESSKTCHFSTVFTLLLLTMVSVSHIYCGHRARFHCVCLNHRGCLIWVKFAKIPKQTFQSQLTVINPCSTRALFSDKARCFNQSERALYGNFIIIHYKQDTESYMYVATQQCISDDLYHVGKFEFAFGHALCRGLDIFLPQLKQSYRSC